LQTEDRVARRPRLGFSCSGRFEFQPPTDELHGCGQCGRVKTKGALDEVNLTANAEVMLKIAARFLRSARITSEPLIVA
jgi:hypothetical protein